MYYLMDWKIDEGEYGLDDLADISYMPALGVPWTMGVYWEKEIKQPIKLEVDDDSGTMMPDAFLVGVPLFSSRLLEVLEKSGVDNYQTYEVVVSDPRSNKTFDNYKAVNIVGMKLCAVLEKSDYIKGSGAPLMHFNKLVIDESKINGAKFFRLGESASLIIVKDEVAKNIIEGKFIGIRLLELESSD